MQTQQHTSVTSIQHPEIADSVLIQQALTGDQDAFETLVHRYEAVLFDMIYRRLGEYHGALDVLQQVLLQLYLSLATLHSRAHIKPWLFTVARNRCVDFLRHKRPTYFSELEPIGNVPGDTAVLMALPDTSPKPEELAERWELQQSIHWAIEAIPARYRPVVWHYYITQLSFPEIGRVLNISTSTAKTHFHRAKPFLRAALAAQLA
jgi:RNA polymerase sigma-70 factor, ECF subfamily